MLQRDRALWVLAILLSIALLIAPAIWNGFPLLQWDTGGYIARWYQHSLIISRSTVYGLFLTAADRLAFWPEIVVQGALTVWVLVLTLRTQGLGNRPLTAGRHRGRARGRDHPALARLHPAHRHLLPASACIAFYLLLMQADQLSALGAHRAHSARRLLRRHP